MKLIARESNAAAAGGEAHAKAGEHAGGGGMDVERVRALGAGGAVDQHVVRARGRAGDDDFLQPGVGVAVVGRLVEKPAGTYRKRSQFARPELS